MNICFIQCPSKKVFSYVRKIKEKEQGDFLDEYVLNRSSVYFGKIFYDSKWVGYVVVESLNNLDVGFFLDDIWNEGKFIQAKKFVEKHIKEKGYFLHVLEIFEEYQGKGLGTKAERKLSELLQGSILLYTVANREHFWLKQGYQSLDGEYYLYKINKTGVTHG